MSQNQIVPVPFNGEIVIAALIDGKPYVPMKPICNNLGLDWKSQYERIQRHKVMKSTVVMMTMVADDDKNREMLCLPLTMLNGWLFGVDANRVKEESREKLETYQANCFDVLAQHFMPAVVQAMQPQAPQPAQSEPPISRPYPAEKLNAVDNHKMRRVVWSASDNFHMQESANQGIWYHLRQTTNNPAPNAYSVEHIPALAIELRRVLAISHQVRQITQHVEIQAIKRIFRKGEAAEKVLAHLEAEAAHSVQKLQDQVKDFPAWMEVEMLSFTERKPTYYGCDHTHEQIDFFISVV